MGLSSVSHDIGDVDAMYPLTYSMMSTNPMGGIHPGLVSILHNTEKKNLVNVRAPETISLNGVVYNTARELAIVFNREMVCDEEVTTTTTEEIVTTTTTEVLITTTTTPSDDVPEGAIQTYATEKYLQTKSGKYITIKAA